MRVIGLVLVSLALGISTEDAGAASKRECIAACGQRILACEDVCVPFGGGLAAPGGRKLVRACRAGVLKRCRKEGVQTCVATATTTSTLPPATTSTTAPPGSTTTTVPSGSSTTTTVLVTTTTVPPTTTTTTAPPSGLAGLIGRWRFTFTIISTFTEDYEFDRVETVGGIPTLIGFDELGGLVIVNRTADLGGGVPYEFAMLDPGFILCDFYVFNRTGTTTIAGQHWTTDIDFDGSCGDLIGGPDPLSGTRLSTLLGSALRATSPAERMAVEAARAEEGASGEALADEALTRILETMRAGVR